MRCSPCPRLPHGFMCDASLPALSRAQIPCRRLHPHAEASSGPWQPCRLCGAASQTRTQHFPHQRCRRQHPGVRTAAASSTQARPELEDASSQYKREVAEIQALRDEAAKAFFNTMPGVKGFQARHAAASVASLGTFADALLGRVLHQTRSRRRTACSRTWTMGPPSATPLTRRTQTSGEGAAVQCMANWKTSLCLTGGADWQSGGAAEPGTPGRLPSRQPCVPAARHRAAVRLHPARAGHLYGG